MKTIYYLLIVIILLSVQNLHAQTTNTFSTKARNINGLEEYPVLSEHLLNTEINLVNEDKKINLADYKNDVIILSLVSHWAGPPRNAVSDLNILYAENLENLRIVAVTVENGESDVSDFKSFIKLSKIKFQVGWTNIDFVKNFFEISKFNGVPQSLVIKDGKLCGIFIGGSPKVNSSMVNLVRKISAEENIN